MDTVSARSNLHQLITFLLFFFIVMNSRLEIVRKSEVDWEEERYFFGTRWGLGSVRIRKLERGCFVENFEK